MLKEKMKVTHEIKQIIIKERESLNVSGTELSRAIGKSDAWISLLENGRIKTITSDDFIEIVKFLLSLSDIEAESYIEKELEKLEKETVEKINTNDGLVYYDEENKTINEKGFKKILHSISVDFEFAFRKDPKYVFNSLAELMDNMNFDLGFILALNKIPFYKLKGTNIDVRQQLYSEINDIVSKYLDEYALIKDSSEEGN